MGCVHIYTGDGKGKTTAALGLALRAAGWGLPVQVIQFLKGRPTGELMSLARLQIPVRRNSRDYGFFSNLGPAERAAMTAEHNGHLRAALALLEEGQTGLLVLDEFIGAYNLGAVDPTLAERLLRGAPYRAELALTGRGAPAWMLERADYVTEMTKQKHPFARGVTARRGIEY